MPDWKKIKAAYIRGGVSYRKLAEKYGVSVSTLSKIAMKEKWSDLRKETGKKLDAKLTDSVAGREAKREDMFQSISDKLLEMINDGIDNGSVCLKGRGLRDITGALKDLREIKGIKSDLDIREQVARIEKLQKDTREDTVKDRTICVVIGDDAKEYTE